jgi:hypothetical protein
MLFAITSTPATVSAQDDPSASPGPDASPAPTTSVPTASFEPAVTLGADTVLFTDTFEEQRWGVGEQTRGSVSYQDDALVIEVLEEDNSLWSWRSWEGASPVLRVEGSITFTNGVGNAAYMCGSENPDFVLGGLNRGEWVVGQVVDSRTQIIDRGPLPDGVDVSGSDPVRLTLECALTGEGNTRALLSIEGEPVADIAVSEIGPFDRAAAYGGAAVPPARMAFDDVTVTVGDSYAPSTELPSPGPSASTPPEAGSPTVGLGADTPAFEDDFSDDSLWVTGETDGGQVHYVDEALAIDVTGENQSLWTWRRLESTSQVVRIEGAVTINDADGAAGWTCGTSDGSFVIGIANTSEWILGTIVDSSVDAIERGPLPLGVDLEDGGTATIALECAWTNPIGAPETRALMWVDGVLVGDALASVADTFDRVGAYADVGTPEMNARFDDATALTGEVYAPVTREEVEANLLASVPEAFRGDCSPAEARPEPGLVAVVACSPAGDADAAVYEQFSTPSTMNQAFDRLLERDSAETPGETCREDASLTTYNIGDEPAGRLACYATSDGGTRLAWTETELWVLTIGDDAQAGYSEMYDWWLEAGPNR